MKRQIVKTTSKLFLALILLLTASANSFSQQQVDVDIRNLSIIDPQTIEFEVWIGNGSTNGDVLKLQSIQMGLNFDPAIAGTGSLSSVLYANNPALSAAGMLNHTPNMATPGHWRVAAQVELSSANATVIPASPTGIRYGTYRITNTVPFVGGSNTSFNWQLANASGKTRTTVTAFINTSTLGAAYTVPATSGRLLNPTVMNVTFPNTCVDGSSNVSQTACDSYTWAVDGNTYTASGQYTAITPITGTTCSQFDTLNLTINNSTASTQTETACDSYTWSVDGNTYTMSGMYTFTGTNAAGCPDVITLDLTINNSTQSTQTETACDSYTWAVDGNTYTMSGMYTFTGTNAAGCPDVQTLDLTINNSTASTQTETACDSYTWSVDGNTYTMSGMYTFTGTNAAGCPDVQTLDLTINNSTQSTVSETACDSYTWSVDGNTYTMSGMYTWTGTNAAGCQDVITLDLTINNSTSSTQTETACDSYTWSVDGNTYTMSGMYTWTGTNAAGCPDVITLDLTINNSTSSTQTETACDTYTWSVDGNTYTMSGMYTYTSTNTAGCPDVQTLDLTINNSTSSTTTVTQATPYTWAVDGNTYTATGVYTWTGTNAAGCPDVQTLNLTISSCTTTATASDVNGCPGSAIALIGTPAGGTFSVANPYTGPTTTYTYTYTDPTTGCTATSAPANITVASLNNVIGLAVTAVTGGSATLTWTPVAGAAYYTLRFRPIGSGTWTYATGTGSSKTLNGLTAGTDYEVEIRANCSVTSPGNYGSYTTFTTGTPCPAPTGMVASNVTATSALITWTPAAGAAWYNIRYRVVGSPTWIVYSTGAVASITLTGLTANTQYEYQVLTKCSANEVSSWSSLENFTTLVAKQGADVTAETFVANVNVYPNPVRDILNIEVTATEAQNTVVKVYDMSGRLVKQIQANTEIGVNNLTISLTDVASGLYTVQVLANDKLTFVSRVNKQD